MPNGYDPERGHILVPFDLKQDVVQPLERLSDGFRDLNRRFDEHVQLVETSVKTKMEPLAEFIEEQMVLERERIAKRTQMKKIMWWSVGIGGPLLLAAFGRVMGLPI